MRTATAISTIALLCLLLCSCSPGGVSIPLGHEDLPQCPPALIEANGLRDLGEPGCNLQGSSLVLPGGTTLEVGEVGAVQSQQFISSEGSQNSEYLVVNWGVPGVGVSKITSGETVSWATSDAARYLQEQQLRL